MKELVLYGHFCKSYWSSGTTYQKKLCVSLVDMKEFSERFLDSGACSCRFSFKAVPDYWLSRKICLGEVLNNKKMKISPFEKNYTWERLGLLSQCFLRQYPKVWQAVHMLC